MDNETQTETDRQQQTETLSQLLKRAENGDVTALPRLREAFDAEARLWEVYGDLGEHATGSLIKLAAGSNVCLAEALVGKVQALKQELAGESPSRWSGCWPSGPR